jgi:ABC-2 type transport system ATP-binding protein
MGRWEGEMIETFGLTKRFGDFVAVDGIDLSVREGEVLSLLGPNGAGKTTTVRMLASILKPTAGWARIAGYDTVRDSRTVRHTVGLLTEFPGLYLRMRGMEYLEFFGQLQGLSPAQCKERSEQLLRRFELWEARDQRTGQYSKGMRQKLALVRAMLHDPQVLFLDEPTSAMDPHSARLVREAISDLRRDRCTIVLCTHNLAEAEELADRIAIIRRGQIVAMGTSVELKNRLLGDPLLELHLAQSLDGLLPELEKLVQVQAHGDKWLRYAAAAPEEVNPRLVRHLAQLGASVVTLSQVPRSLEEVYLRIVDDPASGEVCEVRD